MGVEGQESGLEVRKLLQEICPPFPTPALPSSHPTLSKLNRGVLVSCAVKYLSVDPCLSEYNNM